MRGRRDVRDARAMRARRIKWVVLLLLASAPAIGALTGCGNDDGSRPTLIVSAATSLKQPFTAYGARFAPATVRESFAGSDQLAAQIERGVTPDVYAAANEQLPDRLFAKGLVHKPIAFAVNRLVVAVPAGDDKVKTFADLGRSGATIAMGSASVPVGSYTRAVLRALPVEQRAAIDANVRSNEPDVGGIVGKLTQGAVDAGFVYVTDVEATHGKLRAIELPAALRPTVAYGVAVVKGAKHPLQAKEFIDGLLHGAGRHALAGAGFGAPPQP